MPWRTFVCLEFTCQHLSNNYMSFGLFLQSVNRRKMQDLKYPMGQLWSHSAITHVPL